MNHLLLRLNAGDGLWIAASRDPKVTSSHWVVHLRAGAWPRRVADVCGFDPVGLGRREPCTCTPLGLEAEGCAYLFFEGPGPMHTPWGMRPRVCMCMVFLSL